MPDRPSSPRSDPPFPPMADPVPSGRVLIERILTPTGDWQLQRQGDDFELICSGVFLMATYNRTSDVALATCALARIPGDRLRVLVGGLGVGFTAAAALRDPRVHVVEVVEVEPVVVRWHQDYLATRCGHPLADPRSRLVEADLFDLPLPPASYDAILLDTDNGPNWVARPENARLYQPEMVARLLGALTRRGILAVWSATPAPEFAKILSEAAGSLETVETADEITADQRHQAWIYLAQASG